MESSKLSEHVIREWADEQGLPNLSFAELDYRLARAIGAIYQDDFLKSRLIMKGGTAINKFLLKETSRLSVDLDFNQIGRKEQVLKERRSIRERIVTLLKEQDTRCDIHFKRAYEQTTIKARYRTVLGNTQQFKVEISHIERFAILEPVDGQIKTPSGQADVVTYQLEELTATKPRALLSRTKGRDVYDLFFISKLRPKHIITRKMFLYYLYRSRTVYNPKVHYKNLSKRYASHEYVDDVSGFTRPSVQFSLREAYDHIISYYSFLNDLDELDDDFLALGRLLLGRKVAKEKLVRAAQIQKPLDYLFGDLSISREAREISTDDIEVFRRRQ